MAQLNDEMRQCIDQCTRCHQVCLSTIHHCLRKGGEHARPEHLRLIADCVQICSTSADFMLRGSPFHTQTCGVCADLCESCAQDCEHFKGDSEMSRCALTCRQCAESCRHMAGAAVH